MTVRLTSISAAGAFLIAAMAAPTSAGAAQNGYGPDPDGDTNPATNTTRAIARTGAEAEAELDPPFRTITFEAAESGHDDVIRNEYKKEFGVQFSRGLRRQLCVGQRYFEYDSECTYLAAPSGAFVALYEDEYARPLRIRFEEPVCGAALAAYPTGGQEGEEFEVRIQPYKDDDTKLKPAKVKFTWTHNTFRWRNMVGAYFLGDRASRIDVSIRSMKDRKRPVRLLIDDVAFVNDGCEQYLGDISEAAGFQTN